MSFLVVDGDCSVQFLEDLPDVVQSEPVSAGFGGYPGRKEVFEHIVCNGMSRVDHGESPLAAVLRQGDAHLGFKVISGVFSGIQRIVDEVPQNTGDLPAGGGAIGAMGADFQKDAPFPGVFMLGIQKCIDGGIVGAHFPGDPTQILKETVHVGQGFLRFLQLDEAVDDLKLVHEVVPLGTHFTVEDFHLTVGLGELLFMPGGGEGLKCGKNIGKGAISHDGKTHQRRELGDGALKPAAQHAEDEQNHDNPGGELKDIGGNG